MIDIGDNMSDVDDLRKRIEELENHLPDCCIKGACNNDEEMLVGDVSAQFMNSFPKDIKITNDQFIDLHDKLWELTHKAVKSAIKDREDKIAKFSDKVRKLQEVWISLAQIKTTLGLCANDLEECINELTKHDDVSTK